MRKNLKGCKKLAGETLAGNFTVPVIGSIAVAAMSAISSYISTALFPGDSLYAIIGGEVFSFILSLVICVFSAGLYRIYLNIPEGKPTLSEIFCTFSAISRIM